MSTVEHPPTPQISLPGQAHVAEGPHDQTGMYLMHHAFRRDLATFESAVRHTPVGDASTWRALRRRWARFADVLHHHHTIEDESMWPLLTDKARALGDDAALTMLQDMEAEHERIDPGLTACREGFAAMVDHPCADHRNALDVHVTGLRIALSQHLAHEESEALPFLQRTLDERENAGLERAAKSGYPPQVLPFLIPWSCAGVPSDVALGLLRSAGPVYGVLLRLVRPWYERGERRAFRYAE